MFNNGLTAFIDAFLLVKVSAVYFIILCKCCPLNYSAFFRSCAVGMCMTTLACACFVLLKCNQIPLLVVFIVPGPICYERFSLRTSVSICVLVVYKIFRIIFLFWSLTC